MVSKLFLILLKRVKQRRGAAKRKNRRNGGKRKNRTRVRMNWEERLASLTAHGFFLRYRMTKSTFQELCDTLEPHLTSKAVGQYKKRNGLVLPIQLKLSMVIRYLAGGHVYDCADLHGVAVSTLQKVVRQVVGAINRTFRIKFPSSKDELQRSAVAFAGLSGGAMDGVVGAVDGVIIKITKPAYNGTQYYSRKGFYGFNVQAVCDAERRIVYLAISSSGSTHDSTAFKATKLYAKMEAGKLADEFYLVGDDAYSSCRQILCPYPGRGLDQRCDAFNFYQSRTRIAIECTFGELVGRWGVLWRPLRHKVPMATAIVTACAHLHNWCLDHRAPMRRFVSHAYANSESDGAGNANPIFTDNWGRPGAQAAQARRDELADRLADAGLTRPHRSTARR